MTPAELLAEIERLEPTFKAVLAAIEFYNEEAAPELAFPRYDVKASIFADEPQRAELGLGELRFLLASIGSFKSALRGVEAARAEKDAAYLERNRLVAFLARQFPSGIAKTAIEGWADDWHGCVYIDTPTGQMSWHYHDSHAHLFAGLSPYQGRWDGHTTEQKYQRLAALSQEEKVTT